MQSLREIAEQNQIIRVINGSKLYGTNVATSDDDFQAVFLEPVESIYMRGKMETVQLRDKPEGVRSEAGDVDCTSYSLRHFAKLAADGNPSVLTLLSAPDSAVVDEVWAGRELRGPRLQEAFASRLAGPKFYGYMRSQKERLLGIKKGHVPKRPELVEEFGFDTKYANHVVRLGLQGVEFMTTGRMTLPMPPEQVALLLDIREGKFTQDEVVLLMENVERMLNNAIENSPLPGAPDYKTIAEFIRSAHEAAWDYR